MQADMVFMNGEVITVDHDFSIASALAIKENKIIAVGNEIEMQPLIGDKTTVVDLKGRSLLPGFIDAHLHLHTYGAYKLSCDLRSCKNFDELVTRLRLFISRHPDMRWVIGWGFNENETEEKILPTRVVLDQASADLPIVIKRSCGHIAVANSYALEMAGINEQTSDPEGGKFDRENGYPNGILRESAKAKILNLHELTDQEQLQGIKLAAEDYISSGITSVTDMGGGSNFGNHIYLLEKAVKEGIKLRVNASVVSFDNTTTAIDHALNAGLLSGLGDDHFKIGRFKLFLDGSITGHTAAMSTGYLGDTDNKGIKYLDQGTINTIMEKPVQMGCKITAHAIGDLAVEMMVNCIEYIQSKYQLENFRPRIEHASICPPKLVKRIKENKIIVCTNPQFLDDFGDEYYPCIGNMVKFKFPVKSFLDNGVVVAAGSDNPVTDYHPLIGIHALVNRMSKHGNRIPGDEKISVMDAIKIFTINNAYANFEEDKKGSLEINKLADLVVLNDSILNCPSDQIKKMSVDMTVIDGEVVYQKKSL